MLYVPSKIQSYLASNIIVHLILEPTWMYNVILEPVIIAVHQWTVNWNWPFVEKVVKCKKSFQFYISLLNSMVPLQVRLFAAWTIRFVYFENGL